MRLRRSHLVSSEARTRLPCRRSWVRAPSSALRNPLQSAGFSMPRHEQRQRQQPSSQLLVSFQRCACCAPGAVVSSRWTGTDVARPAVAAANSSGCQRKHGGEASAPSMPRRGARRPATGSSRTRKPPALNSATDRRSTLCSYHRSGERVAGANSPGPLSRA